MILSEELKFRLNSVEVKFNIRRSMKKPREMEVVSAMEVVAENNLRVPIEERIAIEIIAALLMNFDADFRSDYGETVNALQGIEEHSYALKKLDFDLKI